MPLLATPQPLRKSIPMCVCHEIGEGRFTRWLDARLFLWSASVWRGLGRGLHLACECACHLRRHLVLLRFANLAIASQLTFCHRSISCSDEIPKRVFSFAPRV
ncbi:hypothetical protein RHECIAT_CH0001362 [Rhizobium etli CIAT 652]|uniref:Uncharacterized protein n=1 Tax=Rhizobium etli (strain CIAT 652) TaxID=491916 RepID=B3PU38_RHIE6|nr:hypothetical protein RHECIAT_CH0001362 [Rhizobium etli CIAT 652]